MVALPDTAGSPAGFNEAAGFTRRKHPTTGDDGAYGTLPLQ